MTRITVFVLLIILSVGAQGQERNDSDISLLNTYQGLIDRNQQFLEANHEAIFSAEMDDFKTRIDSLQDCEFKLIAGHKKNVGAGFKALADSLKTETIYKHKRYQLLYPGNFHRYSNMQKKADVPNNYYERVLNESFRDPSLLGYQEYVRCMNKYFDILSAKEYKFLNLEPVPLKRIDNRYDAIVGLNAHQEIKDFFIKEHFNTNIWTYRVEAFDYSYKNALKDLKNKAYVEEVKAQYQMGHGRRNDASEIKTYRSINGITLYAHIFYPENHTPNHKKPAHLFFHGGGWAIGLPEWSYGSCKNAAKEGRVAITFDYRLRNVHGTDIKASVSDALTAIAWVREQANELGVESNKILAEGFSAGAHLALVSAMINNPKDFGVASKFSTKPNAVSLGSTPYEIEGRDVYTIDYDTNTLSPLHLIGNNLPPILAFHGEADDMVDFSEFEQFRDKMLRTKNDFTFRSYPNAGHFYFRETTQKDADERKRLTEDFLLKNELVIE